MRRKKPVSYTHLDVYKRQEQWFGEYEETYKKSIKINPRTIVVLIAKREESGHASMAALQDNNEA